jgi:hypothetical protein
VLARRIFGVPRRGYHLYAAFLRASPAAIMRAEGTIA